MKNKDLYEYLCEAQAEYYKELEERKLTITFDSWLFRDVSVPVEEEKIEEDEHDCSHCRFFLNLEALPLMNMASRCLLGFGQVSSDGSCENWQPEKVEEEKNCFNCAYGRPLNGITACVMNNWESKEDDDSCDEWREKK